MANITIGPMNTIAITAASGANRLRFVGGFTHPVDVMNLGPGAIYIRQDADPTVADVNSLEVPANWAVNRVMVDGNTGLGLIAGADTTISVRVT